MRAEFWKSPWPAPSAPLRRLRPALCWTALCWIAVCGPLADVAAQTGNPLPSPSSLELAAFEEQLFAFLNERRYAELGWPRDKTVRDTGPYIGGQYYGTHPAVRVYYSPEVVQWLQGGRRGALPDGAMMIKEQFEAPAARHLPLAEEERLKGLRDWTVMIKDSRGSVDGWFWSNPGRGQKVTDNSQYPFDYPISGFGLYCVRCHAATKSPPGSQSNEYTFASLRNIEGFPGEPVVFRVDDSWRREKPAADPPSAPATPAGEERPTLTSAGGPLTHPKCSASTRPELCQPRLNEEFLALFPSIGRQPRTAVQAFPPVTRDWVVPTQQPRMYLTSNQCMNCHAGLVGPFGPSMFLSKAPQPQYGGAGVHVSPYGEWRWSPMGLAGRDPIFFAQLESEVALLQREFSRDAERRDQLINEVTDTCLSCHGAMGRRQMDLDRAAGEEVPASFTVADVLHAGGGQPGRGGMSSRRAAQYGALAREGISCAVCHRMQPRAQPPEDDRPYLQFFLESSNTGNFAVGKPDEIWGPFADKEIAPYVMEHATGSRPKHSDFIRSSQMCGTCHVINLPVLDRPLAPGAAPDELIRAEANPKLRGFDHHLEQATYLEWLNSQFENELNPQNPQARSCQDCHMPKGYQDEQFQVPELQTRIAAVQDTSYPEAENLASPHELNVRFREKGYRRHTLQGLNASLLEMFRQYDDLLGVRRHDFMTGSKTDLDNAIAEMQRQARRDVLELKVSPPDWSAPDALTVRVQLFNKVGHRFPSGVAFRRAFVELLVLAKNPEGQEELVWSSGRTNSVGALVDHEGRVLSTEFFENDAAGQPQYQPHHQTITRSDQVQVYEHLMKNAEGKITTSFLHAAEMVKENRLLPAGWRKSGPDPRVLRGKYLEATFPGPQAIRDPQYLDGRGWDEVAYQVTLPQATEGPVRIQASVYYQATPPYFLKSLFETAPDGAATRRLHYMASNLDLEQTPVKDWKLLIARGEQTTSPPAK